jgi:hypothetical protein
MKAMKTSEVEKLDQVSMGFGLTKDTITKKPPEKTPEWPVYKVD